MSSYLDTLPLWPRNSPLPRQGTVLFYDPTTKQEYQATPDQVAPPGNAPAPGAIEADDISDASEAGKDLLRAADVASQLALVDKFTYPATADHAAFTKVFGEQGAMKYALDKLLALGAATVPSNAPSVTGFLPGKAAEGASVTITGTKFTDATAVAFNGTPASFQVINATTIQAVVPVGATTGPVSVSNSNGTGTSTASFTVGASSGGGATPELKAALALSLAQITLGASVGYSITPTGGTGPYTYQVTATDVSTGQTYDLGTTKSGSWQPPAADQYAIDSVVTDTAGKTVDTVTRYLNVVPAANRIPVGDAGADLTVPAGTTSAALMGKATDPDGDAITAHAWRQITGPTSATGMPASSQNVVVSNLVAGVYQFGYRATDSRGGQSNEVFVMVTVQAAANSVTLSQEGVVSDTNLSFYCTTGSDQTAKIQAILDRADGVNEFVVNWDCKVSVSQLKLKSNTTLRHLNSGGMAQLPGVDLDMLTNYGRKGAAGSFDIVTRNIKFISGDGSVWTHHGNGYNSQDVAQRQLGNDSTGWNSPWDFRGHDGLYVRSGKLYNSRSIMGFLANIKNVDIELEEAYQNPFNSTADTQTVLRHDNLKVMGPYENVRIVYKKAYSMDEPAGSFCTSGDIWSPTGTGIDQFTKDSGASFGPGTGTNYLEANLVAHPLATRQDNQYGLHTVRIMDTTEGLNNLTIKLKGTSRESMLVANNFRGSDGYGRPNAASYAGQFINVTLTCPDGFNLIQTPSTDQNAGPDAANKLRGNFKGLRIEEIVYSGHSSSCPFLNVDSSSVLDGIYGNNWSIAEESTPRNAAVFNNAQIGPKTGNVFTGGGSTTTFNTSANALALNADDISYPDGSRAYSVFSEQRFNVVSGGSTAVVKAITTQKSSENSQIPNLSTIWLLWNGTPFQNLQCAQNGVEQSFNITLPGSAGVLKVVQGTDGRVNDSEQVQGTRSTSVTFPAGTQVNTQAWMKQSSRLVLISDSIGAGIGCAQPGLQAWPVLLRNQQGGIDITYAGSYGGKRAVNTFGTSQVLDSVMAQLHLLLDNADIPRLYVNLGVNDYYGSIALTAFQSAVAALADRFHAEFPTGVLYYQTLSITNNETAAYNGHVAQDWRDVVEDLSTTRAWVVTIDGLGLWASNQTVDGLHPTAAGHAAAAPKISSIVFDNETTDLSTGLIHHYTLNQTLADSSPNGLTLTAVNGASFVNGAKGVQLVSASQQYLRRAHSSLDDFSNGLTAISRFRFTGANSGNTGRILFGISTYTDRGYGPFLVYFLQDDQQSSQTYGTLNLVAVDASGVSHQISTAKQEFGTGVHSLVCRYDKSNLYMNLDGGANIALTGGLTSIENSAHEFRIGTDERNALYTDMVIDNVWLFSRKLNNSSVQAALAQ